MKGTKISSGIFQQVLKNVSNLIPASASSSLEGELHAAKIKLEQVISEKQLAEALLKEKEEHLHSNVQTQQKLQLEITRLRKLKEFKPVLSFPLEQFLRTGGSIWPKKVAFMSPYRLFMENHWNQAKSENPNARPKFSVTDLAAKWRTLSAEEKKTYQEKYEAEKEAYLQVAEQERCAKKALKLFHEEKKQKAALDLFNQYIKYRKDAEVDENNKRRREKDSLKPKQPLSGFFLFFRERCTALPPPEERNYLEVTKSLGREWKSMTKDERAPYEQIAAEAKERYMQAMELYKQKKAEEEKLISIEHEEWRKVEREQALQLLRKKEKGEMLKKAISEKKQRKEKKTDPNRPKKPPSAFFLFSKETREKLQQTNPGISNATIVAYISVKWKEMGGVEKQKWIDQATNATLQHKKEMEEFKRSLEQQQQQQQQQQ